MALVYLVFSPIAGALTFDHTHLSLYAILTKAGIVTAVPLVIWCGTPSVIADSHDWFLSTLAQQ